MTYTPKDFEGDTVHVTDIRGLFGLACDLETIKITHGGLIAPERALYAQLQACEVFCGDPLPYQWTERRNK